jgi:hypothetical protein
MKRFLVVMIMVAIVAAMFIGGWRLSGMSESIHSVMRQL